MNDHENTASQTDGAAGMNTTKSGPADRPNGQNAEAGAAQDPAAELEAARDKLLRVQAEFENYQKRVMRERADERRYAFLPLLRDLLPIRDNLQRALDSPEKAENASGLLEGVRLVAQQFATVFEQYGCKEIAAQGAEFDPHLHDALTMQPSNDQPAGRVLTVFRPGYQLHDRVVRPAQVVVSSGPETQAVKEATKPASQ